jgi:hypothetical protein
VRGLDRVREGGDVESVLEEIVAARSVGTELKDMFGGPRDWVDGAVPPAVFVLTNALFHMRVALWCVGVAELVIVLIRLVRRETLRHAVSGVIGVGVCIGFAVWLGAGGFFLPGIIINAVYALVFLGSIMFGHPLVGVILRVVSDKPAAWHDHPRVKRAYVEATLGWAAMFAVRAVVQETLRQLHLLGWLAVAKIAMGYPLYLAVLAGTLPYVKWRTRDVPVPEVPDEASEDASEDAAEPEAEPRGEDARADAP